ncbi:unnamed protein product, partial [Musa acuminata var. zebrina]
SSLRFALKIFGTLSNRISHMGRIHTRRKWAFFKRSGLTETDWWDAVGTKDNIGSSASSREGIKCGNLVVVGLSERVVPGWTSLLMNIMPVVISC